VDRIRARDPEAYVAIIGDLNSFYDSPPLDELRTAGLRHVYEFVDPEMPYSYIYQGESETLDHILVTPGLYDQLVRVEVLHIDADYTLPLPGDASAQGVSDHDPLVVTFSLR
jgi:predicted extracellular nuclease